MSTGVKGGKSERMVESGLAGSRRTGPRKNIGRMAGRMTGKVRFWASLGSLQAAPRAVLRAANMMMAGQR